MSEFKFKEDKWYYKLHNIVRDPFTYFIDERFDYDRVEKREPRNLCAYFWSTVASIIVMIGFSIVAILIGFFLLLTSPVWGTVLLIILGIRKLRELRKEKRWAKRNAEKNAYIEKYGVDAYFEAQTTGKPNMLWEMIKAWKGKYCPLIIIEKDDDGSV